MIHGGNSPRLFIWWTPGCIYTHSEVRIGYMVSHISVSHLSVPFYSVGKVFAPSEVYIYIWAIVCLTNTVVVADIPIYRGCTVGWAFIG